MPVSLTRFSRNTVRSISRDIESAIATVAAMYDINIEGVSASFSAAESTFRVHTTLCNAASGVETAEVRAYKQRITVSELPPLYSTFVSRGRVFKIIGWNTRARKYPINAIHVDSGDKYKFPAEYVRTCAQQQKPVSSVNEDAYQESNADDPDA